MRRRSSGREEDDEELLRRRQLQEEQLMKVGPSTSSLPSIFLERLLWASHQDEQEVVPALKGLLLLMVLQQGAE